MASFVPTGEANHRQLFISHAAPAATPVPAGPKLAGAKVDARDPLAVLGYGRGGGGGTAAAARAVSRIPATPATFDADAPEGTTAIVAPLQGTLVQVEVSRATSCAKASSSS